MNWTEIINQFQGQGSIFWVAAVSMAAGATLLFVSGAVLAKRGLVRGWLAARRPARTGRRSVDPALADGTRVELTATGYTASPLQMNPAISATANDSSGDWQQLLARLKKATNSLEEIQQALKNQDQIYGISGLKAPLRDVEYVFKTGRG